MLSKEERKEVVRKFTERKPLLGVFAVRYTATGRVWVGASRNLDATKNGSWLCLRNSKYHDKALQEEWNANGEPMVQYEVVEKLDGDVPPLGIGDLLREMRNYWIVRLSARSDATHAGTELAMRSSLSTPCYLTTSE
jgi:hypothetical protein